MMNKKIRLGLLSLMLAPAMLIAQDKHKGEMREYERGYYHNTILPALDSAEAVAADKKARTYFKIDVDGLDLPTDISKYTVHWHNKPVSQGVTGTCWCFSTTSFYESEIKRLSGKEVKLSEMYNVYWEYVDRARYFVQNRGKMNFGEGSETNALARTYKKYGVVPHELYTGIKNGQPFHNHAPMFKELNDYLKGVKERNAWNEEEVVATTKAILNHYLGEPPTTVRVDSKTYTPQQYLETILKVKADDYVNLMSLKQEPYYTKAEYEVPDNWWNSTEYINLPLDDFMSGVKTALRDGYTISIGGDVSEAGFDAKNNIALVPTFDIPSEYINEDARQMRFSNGSTTDDHAMHIVGYTEKDGKTWFLLKDSGAGSRNCGEGCKSFGYYFMNEDYVKLKMMTATVHKDAVKNILKKVKL